MNALSMKHLRYFEALSRIGHFGRAAEACAISQPALSMQIRELEALIGAPLVERAARQVRLTALGEEFATRARDILRRVDQLGDLVRAAGDEPGGILRIGVIPTVAPYLLPGLIQHLTRRWPALDLRPREAVTRTLLTDLTEGRLDLAILALPVSEPALEEVPLIEEEFLLVRPRSDAGRPVPDAARLAEMRLLLLEEGHCFRDQALSFCKIPASRAPRDLMEGSSLSTLVQMVGAGIGVTLIPEMALPIETKSAQVAVDRLAAPHPKRVIGMVWRRSNPLGPQLVRIAALLKQSLPVMLPPQSPPYGGPHQP
ncbi:hydrogen peroxide-inducible genes activator [Gemmobacter sp. 24YEA27]|uniref:hydrogen peroxide-inducible genes activator n=1 Tax=Gemmobacter sp. 24YEA27 TaxID=3040672 RepID=UPI0024B32377|nr:hydrogen peroxide-inducible genes activator [Gemmobacter sp. 24YEA27]